MTLVRPFDHLVFDLDDTLLDTYRQLIPRATRDACKAMVDAGLATDLEHCLAAWKEHTRHHSRREVFSHIVGYFGVRGGSDPRGVARRGFYSFYHRRVEPDITLFDGVREMLTDLRRRYELHLVTSGAKQTQEEKIRILEIHSFFVSISHIDPSRGQKKRDAFASLMRETNEAPERHLSIGNRIDTDIGEARELGWRACWVRYGEYASMSPSTPIEEPDFTVRNVGELVKVCRL